MNRLHKEHQLKALTVDIGNDGTRLTNSWDLVEMTIKPLRPRQRAYDCFCIQATKTASFGNKVTDLVHTVCITGKIQLQSVYSTREETQV